MGCSKSAHHVPQRGFRWLLGQGTSIVAGPDIAIELFLPAGDQAGSAFGGGFRPHPGAHAPVYAHENAAAGEPRRGFP